MDNVGSASAPTSGERLPYIKLDGGIAGSSVPIEAGNAAALAAQVSTKALLVTHPGQWSETHAPVVNTQATKSHTAGAAGVRHVCTWLAITLANNATGSVQTLLTFNLRDGATGAGTILASFTLALPATAGECRVLSLSGLNLVGTAATAMTLESASAPAAQTAASVAFGGYTTPNA
jgi:hypothetical protein